MSGEDYEDASLERLIDVFRKLSNNQALVSELRQFKTERNFLSHKGITNCLDLDGELTETTASEFQVRLNAIQVEASRLQCAIHEESTGFLGHLYFEEFPE
jgi:hypothetical protein